MTKFMNEIFSLQSANDFAECINKLTDDKQHQITKEWIKKLFPIEIESEISNSLFVHKVHRPYVSKEIAELFECPDVIYRRKSSSVSLYYTSFIKRFNFVSIFS